MNAVKLSMGGGGGSGKRRKAMHKPPLGKPQVVRPSIHRTNLKNREWKKTPPVHKNRSLRTLAHEGTAIFAMRMRAGSQKNEKKGEATHHWKHGKKEREEKDAKLKRGDKGGLRVKKKKALGVKNCRRG